MHLANKGYIALLKESTPGVIAGLPNIYVPYYEESINTMSNHDEDDLIMGNMARLQDLIQGLRTHGGDVTIPGDTNIMSYFLDMLLVRTATSGAGPYTHVFEMSNTVLPNSYTMDIAKGQVVHRFLGVGASEMSPEFDDNNMKVNVTVSALKSFIVRRIASVASAVINFDTTYDPAPTEGLFQGDLIRIHRANGTSEDRTVVSVDSPTAITVNSAPTGTAGDFLTLRPATPSYALGNRMLWARTKFYFADTAANALAGTEERVEKGSTYTLTSEFQEDDGEQRSGAFDPAALARTGYGAKIEVKRFFDRPDDVHRHLASEKRGIVVRHFAGTNHEMRVTFNKAKMAENPVESSSGEIIYQEGTYMATYDQTDGKLLTVTLINGVQTI